MAMHYLIQKHKEKGHKIIVFSDRIFPLEVISHAIQLFGMDGVGMIMGKCEDWERDQVDIICHARIRYVGKSQSCMVLNGRLYPHAPYES